MNNRDFKYMKKLHLIISLIVAGFMAGGCIKDNTEIVDSGEDVPVIITLRTPSPSSTRALTEDQDYGIVSVYVLSFMDNGSGSDDTFLYASEGQHITGSGGSATVVVPLRQSERGERQRLVFLANPGTDQVDMIDTFVSGETKTDIAGKLLFDIYDSSENNEQNRIWDTTTPRYLPMWGESGDSYVITTSFQSYSIGTVDMLRSVARADIVLNPDNNLEPQGFGTLFRLEDVKVYNASQQGRIIPDEANLQGGLAVTPTVPPLFSKGKVHYTATASTEYLGSVREIYLGEYANTDGSGNNLPHADISCIVISGYYDGSGTKTWYRLDFIKDRTTYERWDLLRNNRYIFYVTSVNGPGYGSEQEAFDATPVNIDYLVLEWNDGGMDGVDFDGQNYMKVTPVSRQHWKEASAENIIEVETDHPDGWSYQLTYDNPMQTGWVDITGIVTATPGHIEYALSGNDSGQTRTAYITVSAGRLSVEVIIIQTPWQIDNIYVSPTGEIPIAGETRTVYIEGDFDATEVRAYDLTNDTELVTNTVPAGTSKFADLAVPNNGGDNDRMIAFEFLTVDGDWQIIRTEEQKSYYIDILSDLADGDIIPGQGGDYNINVSGFYPPGLPSCCCGRDYSGRFHIDHPRRQYISIECNKSTGQSGKSFPYHPPAVDV